MPSIDRPRRGEIWLCALGAARSGEPGKTRPVVVVSPEALLIESPRDLVVTIPLSATVAKSALRPSVSRQSGLDEDSVAVIRAIRGLARNRLIQRLGKLTADELREVDRALAICLAVRGGAATAPANS